ncbi:MAG: protease SohB [Polyangiales bacterium]
MDFLAEYGMFLAKAVTLVMSFLVVAFGIAALAFRQRKSGRPEIELTVLNDEFDRMEFALSSVQLGPAAQKTRLIAKRKQESRKAKEEKQMLKRGGEPELRQRLFVLDFDGDVRASANEHMRQEISAILTSATAKDEVLLRLESGGGMVHSYGLAASQLQRVRDKGIPLTISVDKIAASGGYMMACVANQIIAAPFAIVGSIGVVAQIPNLHRLLKKNDVDFEVLTAGEYKRTLTVFGENTDKGREKMKAELEETHGHFKDFIREQRPKLDVDAVATGEHWLGTKALELGLVDKLQTSDDYLMESCSARDIIRVRYRQKQKAGARLARLLSSFRSEHEKSARDLDKPLLM